MISGTFRRGGIYRHRFMWRYPWSLTRWWMPSVWRGGDEWCNDSLCFTVPPLGCLVLFWRPGRLRTMPCPADWGEMDDKERADYAPCGYYYGGRIRPGGHLHGETGVCDQARAWLGSRP